VGHPIEWYYWTCSINQAPTYIYLIINNFNAFILCLGLNFVFKTQTGAPWSPLTRREVACVFTGLTYQCSRAGHITNRIYCPLHGISVLDYSTSLSITEIVSNDRKHGRIMEVWGHYFIWPISFVFSRRYSMTRVGDKASLCLKLSCHS